MNSDSFLSGWLICLAVACLAVLGCTTRAEIPSRMEIEITAKTRFSVLIDAPSSDGLIVAANSFRTALSQSLLLRSRPQNAASIEGNDVLFRLSAERSLSDPAFPSPADQGFRIIIRDREVEVRGVTHLGTWYGVQTLLREDFGVINTDGTEVVMTSSFPYIIRARPQVQKPVFASRDIYSRSGLDPVYVAGNRLLPGWFTERIPKALGVRTGYGRGYSAHSLEKFLPDWNSETSSLCDAGTRKDLAKGILTYLLANPDVSWVDLSLPDGTRSLKAGNCQGGVNEQLLDFLDDEGTTIERQTGRLLQFSLLAYQVTRTEVPNREIPAIVRLTTETLRWSDQCTPIRSHERTNQAIRDWAARTDKLIIWDYMVDFSDYDRPLPNLQTLADDLRYYRDQGVAGVFLQGDPKHGRGGWQEMRYWVAAQLLWDTEQDVDILATTFIKAYYGAAAARIDEYRKLWSEAECQNGYPNLVKDAYQRGRTILEEAYRLAAISAKDRVGDLLVAHLRFGLNHQERLLPDIVGRSEVLERLKTLQKDYLTSERGDVATDFYLRKKAEFTAKPAMGMIAIGADGLKIIRLKNREATHPRIVEESASPTGVSVVQPGGNTVWSVQLPIDDKVPPGHYRIEVEARLEGCLTDMKWNAGSYRSHEKKYDFRTGLILGKAFGRQLLGEAKIDAETTLYFHAGKVPECSELHLARVLFTPI